MTTTTVETTNPHVGSRPRHRPHRHRERADRDRSKDLLADLRYLVGPELVGRDARALVKGGDWPALERRKQKYLNWLMVDGIKKQERRTSPWNTPSNALVGNFAVTIEQYDDYWRRREPVTLSLPPLSLPRIDAAAVDG